MSVFDIAIDTTTETTLLEISIIGEWSVRDFSGTLLVVERLISVLAKVNSVYFDYSEIFNWITNKIITRINTFEIESLIDEKLKSLTSFIPSQLPNEDIRDLRNLYELKKLNHEVEKDLFDQAPLGFHRVVSINYNSPGSIVIEVLNGIATQLSDILNSFLFYKHKKKRLELENRKLSLEVRSYELELQSKEKETILKDLTNAMLETEALSKLKEQLIKMGISEDKVQEFVVEWLIYRSDTLLPDPSKIESIDLLI